MAIIKLLLKNYIFCQQKRILLKRQDPLKNTSSLPNCPHLALQLVAVPLQIPACRQSHCLFKKINVSCDCEGWSSIAKAQQRGKTLSTERKG